MSTDDRDLLILFATETGTAQDVADRIARHCRRLHFHSRVLSIDAYNLPDLISEPRVVFVVATTGAGAAPRTMAPLWRLLLRADLPPDLLDDLACAVFGLGDTAYPRFCWPAKALARRLAGLGAAEICPRGEGDEQHRAGVDGALGPWMDALGAGLLRACPLPPSVDPAPTDGLPPPRVALADAPASALDGRAAESGGHAVSVTCNRRMTADAWFQEVRHFELAVPDDVVYDPGDVAVVYPEAAAEDVAAFCEGMGWVDPDAPFTITHAMTDQTLPDRLPGVTTLRALFTRHLDFNAVPRRGFFDILRYFTTDDLEREKLEEFMSEEGAEELYQYCHRVKRTIAEVLADFRHVRIPREYVFDVFPPLRPRQFSIASSQKAYPGSIHLCVAIVNYRTALKRPRRGVCTAYLKSLHPGDTLRIGILKGLIKLPPDPATPVICIGPGTGIAPMRAVLDERIQSGAHANTLYFGCRAAGQDEHYAGEWAAQAARGALVYRVARSRDGARVYVQDLVRADAGRVGALLVAGAYVFISGSSNQMPAGVRGALVWAVRVGGGRTEEEAEGFVEGMEREGRLVEESWS